MPPFLVYELINGGTLEAAIYRRDAPQEGHAAGGGGTLMRPTLLSLEDVLVVRLRLGMWACLPGVCSSQEAVFKPDVNARLNCVGTSPWAATCIWVPMLMMQLLVLLCAGDGINC
jgi:hypothetical protein